MATATATETITLADRLNALCQRRGLSNHELAERTGIPVGSIYAYSAGRCAPGLMQLQRLCRALNCGLSAFDGVTLPADRRRRTTGATT